MARLKFGAFLAPHHPIGENPLLQFRRDLDFVEQIDTLGFDEFWCGEHHSSGWEMIASPEMFLAAAAERTKRIKLGTGVVSLPYHHPFNVAQRMVQLDHMSGGRAIFGSGPGALSSDAYALGIDPMVQRDRQDEAIGIIKRLMAGERVTAQSEWFTLRDAALQILPLQEEMPFVTASQISPSGMTLAGKHGIGVGFAHDWANVENTFRSWDMVARYVIPEINGYVNGLRRSQKHVIENRESFERAGQAVMAKIMENDKAAAALAVTRSNRFAA